MFLFLIHRRRNTLRLRFKIDEDDDDDENVDEEEEEDAEDAAKVVDESVDVESTSIAAATELRSGVNIAAAGREAAARTETQRTFSQSDVSAGGGVVTTEGLSSGKDSLTAKPPLSGLSEKQSSHAKKMPFLQLKTIENLRGGVRLGIVDRNDHHCPIFLRSRSFWLFHTISFSPFI